MLKADLWEVQDAGPLTLYLDTHDLLFLGLIPTHPEFTSFLSSVDVHALHDYAKDNVIVVSIVLAPELDTKPVFCLTQLGLTELPKCKQRGFHKHKTDDKRLYREAEHVIDDESERTQVVYLRVQL